MERAIVQSPWRAVVVPVFGLLTLMSACWDFDYLEGAKVADASAEASADASAERVVSRCVVGGYYCGGERVPGDPRALHRCNGDGTGTLMSKCATACLVAPPGKDDACAPATSCVVSGTYCGGDKVNGDPEVLYRCNAGATISVVKRCASGCRVNANDDDACK